MRKFTDTTLVIASHNQGKVREIGALLAPYGLTCQSSGDLGVVEPDETEQTYAGNAILKARHTATVTHCPALADDSGLSVTALDGQPGVHSARFAETANGVRDFGYGMEKIHAMLGQNPDRRAQFVCALALAWPDGHVECVQGTVDGTLTWPVRGTHGFGYDPMFVPTGHDLTFGEMDPGDKHAMSHRANAFEKLVRGCFA